MPVTDYTPTVQDVARLLRARTRNSAGDLVRDFTEDTLPTAEDVQGLIELAADNVSAAIGQDVPSDLIPAAKALTIYLASANVELSYWPEQASATGSMYDKLMARYTMKLGEIESQLSGDLVGGELPTDEFGTNWLTLGGGFPDPYWWRFETW